MEKFARKQSSDPAQEKLRADKASLNKQVSAFINNLIHLKKLMNGAPNIFHNQKSAITFPIPADPATIIGSLAGDFQEIASKSNAIIEERITYSKNRRQKQVKPAPGQRNQPTSETPASEKQSPDLSQQLALPAVASSNYELIKTAERLQNKWFEKQASNPFSRFITRLITPRIGFGEKAQIRQLRMTMLDSCVKANKELKRLHKEIVKSTKESIEESHKKMTAVWNHWNAVNKLFSTFKILRPQPVQEDGGEIVLPKQDEPDEQERQERAENGEQIDRPAQSFDRTTNTSVFNLAEVKAIIADSKAYGWQFSTYPDVAKLGLIIDKIEATPVKNRLNIMRSLPSIFEAYEDAVDQVSATLGVSGSTFKQVKEQVDKKRVKDNAEQIAKQKQVDPVKQAQLRQLRKLRHQILPGGTSGTRIQVYKLITQVKSDLDQLMNLLEKGFDETAISQLISQIQKEMSTLRTMLRALFYSTKPSQESPMAFF